MSTIDPLGPNDFPITAIGQYVYRCTASSPFVGPVSMALAADLAWRLNQDHYGRTGGTSPVFFAATPTREGT